MAWQPSLEDLQDPIFMSQQLQALDETIDASVNHPSVIIWGFLNEGEANVRAAREAYQQLAKFTKLKDPSRLVSWASRHKVRDETLDLADVIAFNDYPGWYDALVPDIPAVWQSYADWVRVHHPGKAVLIAEAGASGLANFLRPANSSGAGLEMWSEDLQAAIVGATIASAVAAGYAGAPGAHLGSRGRLRLGGASRGWISDNELAFRTSYGLAATRSEQQRFAVSVEAASQARLRSC